MGLPPLLTGADWHRNSLSRAASAGTIVAVLPGVYLRRDLAGDPLWLAAAAMRWRPGAVITGALAAQITFWQELDVDVVDVATRTLTNRPGYRFSRRTIPEHLVQQHGHFRISAPALTAIDLAVTHSPEAIDHALRSRLLRISDLHAALTATPGRAGNRARRAMLLGSRTEPWSEAERRCHHLLIEAGITGWVANAPVSIDGKRYWLDIAFRDVKLALEVDGYQFHSARDSFEADRARHNALTVAGWTTLHVTWRQVTEHPDYVVRIVRRALRRAAA